MTKQEIKQIDEMIREQEQEYQSCKEGRTARMKNEGFENWGMVDARNRIGYYKKMREEFC